MKILRSFEEFLFEAMTWVLFYPLTLWRIVTRPIATMRYSNAEQDDEAQARYDEAISPPLLLLITLVLVNLVGAALHVTPPPGASSALQAIESSTRNLIIFRSLIFSLLPLVAAVTMLRVQGARLSREALRPPFYGQCYLVAPLAIGISGGGLIQQRRDIDDAWGVGLMALALGWFVIAETRWFTAELGVGGLKAFGLTVLAIALAFVAFVLIAIPLATL